ncbi:MAG: hypothetical protein ACOZQL_40610 [Myxococcota bacterium]
MSSLDALRGGGPFVVDVLVDFEAEDLAPRLERSQVLYWRHRPSDSFGARVRRAFGFYSGESSLGAAVRVTSGEEADRLLFGTTLWDAEFSFFPVPATPLDQLPDPHFEIPGFAAAVGWTLNQDLGSETWLVTAQRADALDEVCATLSRAFEREGLACHTELAPPEVYGPVD